jgi:hypothetical protein
MMPLFFQIFGGRGEEMAVRPSSTSPGPATGPAAIEKPVSVSMIATDGFGLDFSFALLQPPVSAPGRSLRFVHAQFSERTLAFFDKALKGKSSALLPSPD